MKDDSIEPPSGEVLDTWHADSMLLLMCGAALLDAIKRGKIQRATVLALVDEFMARCDEKTLSELFLITGKQINLSADPKELMRQVKSLSSFGPF